MNNRTMSIVLLAVGAVLLIVSLTADVTRIGVAPGFGYKQIIGSIAGIIGVVVGIVLYSKK